MTKSKHAAVESQEEVGSNGEKEMVFTVNGNLSAPTNMGCIICGGVVEIALIFVGLKALVNWFKKRHDKKKCDCCQGKEHSHE